jgi:hypothetical protein
MPGPITDMAHQIAIREVERDPGQFKHGPSLQEIDRRPGGMTPDQLHTLGGLSDAASTYYFMKTGRGREANPLVTAGAGHTSPEATGLAALGGLGLTKLAKHLLARKWPGLADALAANLGAEQLSLAVGNVNHGDWRDQSSFGEYGDAMTRHHVKRSGP